MTTLTRKEKEKEKRRNDIIDAAESLLKVKSIESITMDEIADKVSLSKGTLYLYFSSKKELSLAIHNRALEIIVEKFAQILAIDLPGIDLVHRMSIEYIDYIVNNPRYMETFMHNESLLFPHGESGCISMNEMNTEAQRCHENASRMFSYIIRAIQVGMSDGSIVYERDPKELAVMFWGGFRGLFHISYLSQKGLILPSLEDMDLSFKTLFTNYLQVISKAIKN